ncbi:fibronectin type III domain-containing protein, partial [Microcella sp.]|uniref:fibronectin type III domain-containing protein n=1 Tax=Microcella sp. TaxID=1913979 RepID=UPI003919450B
DRIQAVVDDGHLVVVAAGNNSGADACSVSPAAAPSAITVGSTTSTDARSSFSNIGTCLDLFAPGSSIASVDWDSTATMTMSGTSMASPHVAGIGALVLSQNPGLTPAQVTSMIIDGAQTGVVTNAGTGSPNRLASVRFLPLRPGALTGISSTVDEQSRIVVDWSAPVAQTGLAVTDYAIEYKAASASTWTRVNDGTSTATSFTFTTLAESTTYDVRVAVVSGTGLGAWSTVQATVPRLTPTAVGTLSVDDATWNALSLSWTAPETSGASGVVDYELQYSSTGSSTWTTVADGVSSTPEGVVTGLASNREYQVRVRAVNDDYSGAWSTVTARTQTVSPAAVTSLTVTDTTATSMSLSWTAPEWSGSTPVSDYRIQYSGDNGATWYTFSDGVSTATTATVSGRVPNRSYLLRVSAVNEGYTSAATTVSARTRTASPAAVTGLTVTGVTTSSMSLSWTAPTWAGSSAIRDYRIQYSGDNGKTWYTFTDGVSTATTATVSGRLSNRTYQLRVAAVNSGYTGSYTKVTTKTLSAAPGVVTGLTVTGVTSSSMSLAWTAPTWTGSSAIRDYRIQYSGDNGKTWYTFTDGVSTATTATVSGRLSNRTYQLRVAAVNSGYTGGYTKVTTKTLSAAPGVVTGLTVTGVTSSSMSLAWTAPTWTGSSAIRDYRIQYSGDNGKTWYTFTDGVSTATTATVSGRLPDRAYLLRVAAINSGYTGSSVTVATRTLPAV